MADKYLDGYTDDPNFFSKILLLTVLAAIITAVILIVCLYAYGGSFTIQVGRNTGDVIPCEQILILLLIFVAAILFEIIIYFSLWNS